MTTPHDKQLFITGGPVPLKSTVYISREIEKDVFTYIQQKRYVTIIGSRQIGKSSLLQRIQERTEKKNGYASALIDLSPLNDPDISQEQWTRQFFKQLEEQLAPFVNTQHHQKDIPIEADNIFQIVQYFQELAAKINRKTILILLDEASSIPPKIRDIFYSKIRWIYTDRTAYRPVAGLKSFNFVFSGVFEPEKLIVNRENSPFNVSRIIRLPDFSKDETTFLLTQLTEKYKLTLPSHAIDDVYGWTSGHPYLTQCLMAIMDRLLQAMRVPNLDGPLIDSSIPLLEQEASDNIENTGKLVMDSSHLRDFIKRILHGEDIPFSRVNGIISQLVLIGAVKKGAGENCRIRNRIYEFMFKKSFNSIATEPTHNRDERGTRKTASTVFVSSTFRDLKIHRQAVIEQILRRDLLFRGMEHFGAHPYGSPATLIVKEVQKADVYLGIFGARYGEIHKETGLSMTELEFNEAERNRKPMLLYMISENAPVKLSDMENDPKKIRKYNIFKNKIMKNHVIQIFENIDDLKHKVYQDLGKLP